MCPSVPKYFCGASWAFPGSSKTRKRKLLDVKQVSSGRGQYQKHLVAVEETKVSKSVYPEEPVWISLGAVSLIQIQIITKPLEPTMKVNNNINSNSAFTTRYNYGNKDSEFVFTCKGRPFAVLVSDNIPTPTSTLLDFDLVKSLGLKVTDLQCRKFSFAGNKLRILGRVSTAVQCLDQGRVSGNYHIKGFVVSDLNTLLDTHCVASLRMRQQSIVYNCTASCCTHSCHTENILFCS